MTTKSRPSIRNLTKETERMLTHTCNAFVHFTQQLLSSGISYVMLGWFATDPLGKYVGKLRQGSGGTYFFNAQSVMEKVRIHHGSLALRLGMESDLSDSDRHHCHLRTRVLTSEEAEIFDNLFSLEEKLTSYTLNATVYIGGYIEKKFLKSSDDTIYHQKYGKHIDHISRGQSCSIRTRYSYSSTTRVPFFLEP